MQLEDEPYNPDYVEVDRVLDMAEHTDPNTGKTIKHYLVKWRSMQYEDSTWELEEDVDPVKIQHYEIVNLRPPKEKWKVFKTLSIFSGNFNRRSVWSPKETTLRVIRFPALQVCLLFFPHPNVSTFLTDLIEGPNKGILSLGRFSKCGD